MTRRRLPLPWRTQSVVTSAHVINVTLVADLRPRRQEDGGWGTGKLLPRSIALPSLIEVVLSELDKNKARAVERDLLCHACAVELRRTIQAEEFDAALDELQEAGDIEVDGSRISCLEPKFREKLLEDQVEHYLFGRECCRELKIDKASTVFLRIARGGSRDTGMFSRPDFVAATVRQLKYDPLRHLDVITFELKNIAGATLMGVHEALAHTRFAHYSYLVCPKSRVRVSRTAELREECARYGLGLIVFDLVKQNDAPQLSNFAVELKPLRKMPDPYDVEEFLDDRLPEEQRRQLEAIARGR